MTLGVVAVDIRTNTAKFVEGIDKANKKLDGFGRTVKKATIAIGALAGVGGFGYLIKQSFAAGDALAKQSDKLQIATKDLAALNQATQLYTSAGLNSMAEALTKAEKRLGEFAANGGGAANQWLERFNFNIQDLQEQSPSELFATYADAIQGLNTRGEQLAAISALMGDEARALAPLIDQGSEAIRKAAEQTERFGTALSRTDLAQFEAANDAAYNMGQSFQGLGNQIALTFAPIIKWVSEKITDLVVWVKDRFVELNSWLSTNFAFFEPIEIDLTFKPKGFDSTFESKELDNIRNFLKSKEDLERESWERKFDFLSENSAKIEGFEKLWFDLHIKYLDKIEKEEAGKAQKRKQLQLQSFSDVASAATSLTSIFKDQSKKAFKVHQAAAITESMMNTYQAYTKTLASVPAPFNFAAAAAVFVAGIAKVHAIGSMSPGSSGGGSFAAPSAPTESLPSSQIQRQETPEQTINIHLGDELLTTVVTKGFREAVNNDQVVLSTENGRERIIAA